MPQKRSSARENVETVNVTEVWRRLESDPRVEDAEHWVAVYAELERSLLG